MKKVFAYLAVLLLLVAASVVVNDWRVERELEENPDLLAGGEGGTPRDDRDYAMPPPGPLGRPMFVSELAWMLRERMALDVLEDFADEGAALEAYNERVAAYNQRAVEIEYRAGELLTAEKRVDAEKGRIVADALDEGLRLAMPDEWRGNAAAARIWTVQKFLKLLGFYAGRVTGRTSATTEMAIRLYLERTGDAWSGSVDDALAGRLRNDYLAARTPERVGFDD